jgi:hypothetical protein
MDGGAVMRVLLDEPRVFVTYGRRRPSRTPTHRRRSIPIGGATAGRHPRLDTYRADALRQVA